MPALSNFITITGIVFPTPFGYFVFIFILIKDLFKKLSGPFLINSNYQISTIITFIFLTFHFFIPIFNGQFTINPEIKSIFFIAIASLILVNKKKSNDLSRLNNIFNIIIIYSFFWFIFSVLFNQKILRFTDDLFIFRQFQWSSVYFGAFFVVIYAISKLKFHKISSFIFVLLSGSGTALIGLFTVIFASNYIYIRKNILRIFIKKRFLAGSILVLTIFGIFIISQLDRNRNILDFSTIDRYVIQSSFLSYYFENFSIFNFLVGKGFSDDITEFVNYVDKNSFVYGYINLKLSQFGGAAILHSEFLRLINNFGIIGYGIFLRQIFLLVQKDKILFSGLLMMGFFTSICFTNSIFLLLVTLYDYRINDVKRHLN